MPHVRPLLAATTLPLLLLAAAACSRHDAAPVEPGGAVGPEGPVGPVGVPDGGWLVVEPPTEAGCKLPAEAALEDISRPTTVVGKGTPDSCTARAFIDAVAVGGVITFDCGPNPVTITLPEPALVYNDASPEVVIDGGGLVTLSGGGKNRVLYMNTCDQALHWTTSHCDDQDHPRLTVQNITFVDGYDAGEGLTDGGGAIFVRGGRFKAIDTRFYRNRCNSVGQDVGGGAMRVFDQSGDKPVYVVRSVFGGTPGYGNSCSNGGALSSIHVSWTIIDSAFSYNTATGNGGNPKEAGTPGGGSGGAIYNDGNTMTLSLCGAHIEHNTVNAYGQAIFFISNNHDGTLVIEDSVIRNNVGGSWYALPGISMHDDTVRIIDDASILE